MSDSPVDSFPFDVCANCGASFEFDVRYPLHATETQGRTELKSFCDDACKREWLADD